MPLAPIQKISETFFCFSIVFLHLSPSDMKQDYYHQKINVQVISSVTKRLQTWDLQNEKISGKSRY